MNKSFTRYATRTGKVLDIITIPFASWDAYDIHNTALAEDIVDGDTHYFVGGHAVPRPQMNVVLDRTTVAVAGDDVVTLSGLPDGCEVFVEGPVTLGPIAADDQVCTIAFDYPGEYVVKLIAWPYLDLSFSVEAY